jgi:N-acetylmuramoyl-L-alanine amidase
MKIISYPSPNFDSREGQNIDMLVLHYTGMKNGRDAIERLCDAGAKVSAHYVIDEDGSVYGLVEEAQRAWHAGVSYWRGQRNINQRSIGIELINPGHDYGYREFPRAQMEALAELCKEIISRHHIPARNVVGHSDVAPERKQDPGEKFDWHFLASQGIGLVPSTSNAATKTLLPIASCLSPLENFGYNTENPAAAITAFQRHFRQTNLSGQWDSECEERLNSLFDLNML